MKLFKLVVFVLVLSFSFASFAKAPEGTPTRAIQDLDAKLDDYKTGDLTEEEKEYNTKLKKDILHGTFDVMELSRLALAENWLPRTYRQRRGFVDLMTQLLENKAILSKEQGQKKAKSQNVYRITYQSEKFLNKKETRSMVRTDVYVVSEDIHVKLDYKLRKKRGSWKIYDVILDGASLVDNYRYQFDRIITKHGYPELVRRMNKKLVEIKSEE